MCKIIRVFLTGTLIHHMNKFSIQDSVFVSCFLNSLHIDDLSYGDKTNTDTFEFLCKSGEQGHNMSLQKKGEGHFLSHVFIVSKGPG